VSATALAVDCMTADALATVMMVMAPADALRLADRTQLRALLIGHTDGRYEVLRSASWRGAPGL
jgi:thiamine biosynthesis lipoprotein ApbE